jgi:phosphohistidine phosphatase
VIVIVCLVHHADALSPADDSQRPLSSVGLAQADAVASKIRGHGFAPAAIWHSGKLRARQTAEASLRIVSPFAEFKMIRGLSPDDPPSIVRDALLREARDILLVGHMPHLPSLLRLLTGDAHTDFPLHGAVAVQSSDNGLTWIEQWRERIDQEPSTRRP